MRTRALALATTVLAAGPARAHAAGVTQIADVIVPAVFSPYVQQITQQKSRIIQSGVATVDATLSNELSAGGLTFNEPSFKDLDNDAENVATDDPTVVSTPKKIQTADEIQIRLSRNQSWSSMDLASDLIGVDPMDAIANRVAYYWTRRIQAAFVATMNGVFNDNAAAPTGSDTHTINDMTRDISGAAYAAGVTDFSAQAFIQATLTMGDSMADLSMVMMHSIVYAKALQNNLIQFVPASANPDATLIARFLGREVVVDDGVPFNGGVFQTWFFGPGAFRMGMNSPKTPTEVRREPSAGNGSGQEILFNRTEWIIHPAGHAFIGAASKGGPDNTGLANAANWARVFPERKQIKIARLITREM